MAAHVEPHRSRVLVVDDNARNVAILEKVLGTDHEISTAGSGEDALAVAGRFAPDLVLLDIMMPGIDGFETCRRMRTMPELRHTRIIMVSAKAMPAERHEGFAAGADDYVTKPFDEDDLRAKIRVTLRLKSLEEISGLQSQFLSTLCQRAHTPLTDILGPAERLLGDAGLTDSQRAEVAAMQAGAHQLRAWIERVTLLAELRAGRARMQLAPCDLSRIAGAAVDDAAASAAARGVRLQTRFAAPVVTPGDARYLGWTVSALLDNAIRHTPKGGGIAIAVADVDGAARLTIADSGTGISPALIPHVFEPFATGADDRTAGLGMSLATARAIVRHHSGALTAHSAPGAGTVFTLELPLLAGDVARAA